MQIHYFQRYHSKENVDTSNTMLMLSRLYNYNADKFFSMLNSLILGEDESPEITFDLQVAGDESVPDAVISQKSFKIVVETKLYNQFDKQQLVNHLEQFGAEDIKVLLTIDPRPMKPQLFDEMNAELKKYNSENLDRLIHPIKHVNLTFEQLVEAMEDKAFMDEYYDKMRADDIEELSSQRNEDYSDRADDYKAAKQALLEGLGLSHLFSGNRKLTPEEKELWLLFDRVYVTELLARDEFAKGAYMLGAEDRETMLR